MGTGLGAGRGRGIGGGRGVGSGGPTGVGWAGLAGLGSRGGWGGVRVRVTFVTVTYSSLVSLV